MRGTTQVEAVAPTPSLRVPAQVQRCGGTTCPLGTCDHDGEEVRRRADGPAPSAVPPSVLGVLGTPGTPLDDGTRTGMEGRFGHDFGRVRIHTDADAARSAADLRALAYTFGPHVVMGAGRYQPHSAEGQRLLAHELTHVVQQGEQTGRPTSISDPHDAAEHHAEATAGGMTAAPPPVARYGIVARQDGGAAPSVADAGPASDAGAPVADAGPASAAASTPATPSIDAGTAGSAGPTGTRTRRPIADLEREFRSMASTARSKGFPVAADNLVHFLDGGGTTRSVPLTWLRSFGVVTAAEQKNHERFEGQLNGRARGTPVGGSTSLADHWDARIDAWVTTELFYASGVSQLTSTGTFTLTRAGTDVSISGTVDQRWFDRYDWNPGSSAPVPGFGTVSDDVGLDLKDAGRGHDYLLENRYQQALSGTYTVRPWYLPDSRTYSWSGP